MELSFLGCLTFDTPICVDYGIYEDKLSYHVKEGAAHRSFSQSLVSVWIAAVREMIDAWTMHLVQ